MEHNSPFLKFVLCIVTPYKQYRRKGRKKKSIFRRDKPDKHYLHRAIKININSDKSCNSVNL